MIVLFELFDGVFTRRCVQAHWNLQTIVETIRFRKNPNGSFDVSAVPPHLAYASSETANYLTQYHYVIRGITAVRTNLRTKRTLLA